MKVIKTKKGLVYREKIYVDGKEINSPRFTRKADAKDWKARMLNDRCRYQASGVKPLSLNLDLMPTFKEYSEMWLETRVKTQLAIRTYEHYESVIRTHLNPNLGEVKLHEIRLTHADQIIKKLSDKGHNAKGINLIIRIFKRVMIEATRENRIERNPLLYLKDLKEPPSSDVFMTVDEIKCVLETSKNHVFYSLFLVAVNTGMRRGELAGLCWDRVNFNLNLIEISRIKDRNGLADRTKTLRSRRFIPMNTIVRQYLMELKAKNLHPEFVFVHENGSEFDVNHLYRDFQKFLKRARIKNKFRFHDIRHTFASHFMMNGGNIYDLQKILGHTSLEMTQRYAHLAPEHLVQAANVVRFGEVKENSENKNRLLRLVSE